jgi:hypothetical protein
VSYMIRQRKQLSCVDKELKFHPDYIAIIVSLKVCRSEKILEILIMQPIVRDLLRVVPLCFFVGAGMELFMIKTGFYSIVTRKEAERRAEYRALEEERKRRLARLQLPTDLGRDQN